MKMRYNNNTKIQNMTQNAAKMSLCNTHYIIINYVKYHIVISKSI